MSALEKLYYDLGYADGLRNAWMLDRIVAEGEPLNHQHFYLLGWASSARDIMGTTTLDYPSAE